MITKFIVISCKYYRRCGDVLVETLLEHTEDIKQIISEMQEVVAVAKEEHVKNESHYDKLSESLIKHFDL